MKKCFKKIKKFLMSKLYGEEYRCEFCATCSTCPAAYVGVCFPCKHYQSM